MKSRSKLFPLILALSVLPWAGCFHSPYDPATALANDKIYLQKMAQGPHSHIDAASKETLDKIIQVSQQDPGKASVLVGNLADNSPAREAGVITVAQSWYAKDPTAATDWLNGLPPGQPRDYGVEAILLDAVRRDPSTALGLANTISYGPNRMHNLEGVVALWAKTDPAAASAGVQSAKLTDIVFVLASAEQERAILLRAIQKASSPANNNPKKSNFSSLGPRQGP